MGILMRKFQVGTLILSIVGGILLIGYANWDKRYPIVTLPVLNELESAWYSEGILDYDLSIEVRFAQERRMHDITVRDGLVQTATVYYWDDKSDEWGTGIELDQDSAYWFTFPGLFQTIREELQNSMRDDIRIAINHNPTYPKTILLGPITQTQSNSNLTQDTEVEIYIKTYQPINP